MYVNLLQHLSTTTTVAGCFLRSDRRLLGALSEMCFASPCDVLRPPRSISFVCHALVFLFPHLSSLYIILHHCTYYGIYMYLPFASLSMSVLLQFCQLSFLVISLSHLGKLRNDNWNIPDQSCCLGRLIIPLTLSTSKSPNPWI